MLATIIHSLQTGAPVPVPGYGGPVDLRENVDALVDALVDAANPDDAAGLDELRRTLYNRVEGVTVPADRRISDRDFLESMAGYVDAAEDGRERARAAFKRLAASDFADYRATPEPDDSAPIHAALDVLAATLDEMDGLVAVPSSAVESIRGALVDWSSVAAGAAGEVPGLERELSDLRDAAPGSAKLDRLAREAAEAERDREGHAAIQAAEERDRAVAERDEARAEARRAAERLNDTARDLAAARAAVLHLEERIRHAAPVAAPARKRAPKRSSRADDPRLMAVAKRFTASPIVHKAALVTPERVAVTDLETFMSRPHALAGITSPVVVADIDKLPLSGACAVTPGDPAVIRTDADGRARFSSAPAEDWPTEPITCYSNAPEPVPAACIDAITRVSYAVSEDESKPDVRGVYFDRTGAYATDGRRMARRFADGIPPALLGRIVPPHVFKLFTPDDLPGLTVREHYDIPTDPRGAWDDGNYDRRFAALQAAGVDWDNSQKLARTGYEAACDALPGIDLAAALIVRTPWLCFESPTGLRVVTRCIDGKFPTVANFYGTNEFTASMGADRVGLTAAVKAVLPVAKACNYTVSLRFAGNAVTVTAVSSKAGLAEATAHVYTAPAKPFTVSMNAIYLLDALEAIDEPVVNWDAVTTVKAQYLNRDHVLMPIRSTV